MLKQNFKDQLEFNLYTAEQKTRMEKGYLLRSEREILKKMLEKDYKPIFIKEDNIKEIIQKLKDTLACYKGLGLSANQIGIQKRISYIKIPKMNKDKQVE